MSGATAPVWSLAVLVCSRGASADQMAPVPPAAATAPGGSPVSSARIRADIPIPDQVGVPAVYLMPGLAAADSAVNGQQVFGGFLASHYHKPGDDLALPMDLAAVERFTRADLAIAAAIANDRVDPTWKDGSFFGTMFEKGN